MCVLITLLKVKSNRLKGLSGRSKLKVTRIYIMAHPVILVDDLQKKPVTYRLNQNAGLLYVATS